MPSESPLEVTRKQLLSVHKCILMDTAKKKKCTYCFNNAMGFIQGNARRLKGHRFMGQSALTRYNLLGSGKGLRNLPCRDYLNNGQRMYNLGVLVVFSLPSETFCHFNFCNCLFMWKGFCLIFCISQSDHFREKNLPKPLMSLWPWAPQAFCVRGTARNGSHSVSRHLRPVINPLLFRVPACACSVCLPLLPSQDAFLRSRSALKGARPLALLALFTVQEAAVVYMLLRT